MTFLNRSTDIGQTVVQTEKMLSINNGNCYDSSRTNNVAIKNEIQLWNGQYLLAATMWNRHGTFCWPMLLLAQHAKVP